jgi:hypothetical protein
MSWIGVDLDGTLAQYPFTSKSGETIGPPVPRMLTRVKSWLADGKEVRIMTARISHTDYVTVVEEINQWCKKYVGKILPVTNEKDYEMIELWDDRAVQVIPNTGMRADGKI